jgi:hypothetical protein
MYEQIFIVLTCQQTKNLITFYSNLNVSYLGRNMLYYEIIHCCNLYVYI